jgi:hypothetical protein
MTAVLVLSCMRKWGASDRLDSADMGVDPIRERLRPACVGKSAARRAENGDEDLRLPDFAGQPVDDDGRFDPLAMPLVNYRLRTPATLSSSSLNPPR